MGLVLNPYAFRIGHVNSWSDSWYLISTEYVEFLHSSIMLKSFVYYVLYKFYPTRFSYWLVSHIEILFFNNNMYIWLYLYEASGKYKITKHIKLFKYGLFKGYRLRTYWLKKNLFDRNPVALSIFNFLRLFGSHIERYDSVENYVFNNRIRGKIRSLRKRYGYKWLGIEEIYVLRTALSIFKRSASRFALTNLSMIIKSLFFLPIRDGSLSIYKLRGPRIFMFFFSYFLLLLRQWPYYKSWANHFVSKIIFVFLRQTVFFLFFNPFIKYLSKFIEYLCSFFGYSSVVRASVITNFSLSAFFIARYIMTAIKNGFNYWDILFPIRKTLGRFMEIKLFDNYINKQTTFKSNNLTNALKSGNRRVNLVIFFVVFLRHKLFFNDFYKSLYSHDGYNKLFCFMKYLIYKKKYIVSKYRPPLIILNRSHIFKRFLNDYRKVFFKYIYDRITFERVNEIRRLTRPPITLLQKEKYNKRRRMKRLEKRSIIELAEFKETYLQLNKKFNSRLSAIKKYSHAFIKARHDLMIERRSNNFRRFFSTNNKKNNVKVKFIKSKSMKLFVKFYIILFIIKFFKNVRFKLKKQKLPLKKLKVAKRKKLIKERLILHKRFFIVKRLKLISYFKNIILKLRLIKRFYYFILFKNFPLFFCRFKLRRNFGKFSSIFLKFFNKNYFNKKNVVKRKFYIKSSNIKHIKRNYHSSVSNYDFIINILKDLAKKEDRIDKRHLRISYKKLLKEMTVKDYRNYSISPKNMPSIVLTRLLKDANNSNVIGFNKILNNIDVIFFLVNYIKSLYSGKNVFDHKAIFFIVKFYEVLHYLLLLKLYGLNHYKINNMFVIIRICFNIRLNDKNHKMFILLNKALNKIKSDIIKYIKVHCISSNYWRKNQLIMFNFLSKFISFFSNKGFSQVNSFNHYLLFLLNSIMGNYRNAANFNNIFIKRILLLIDNYWYYGFKNFKRYSSKILSNFLDKFYLIFSIILFIFKFIFTKIEFNDKFFPVIYQLLLDLMPLDFKPDWLMFNKDFLPYSINSKFRFRLVERFFYSDSSCLKYYLAFNEDTNYVGRDNFHVFLSSRYNYVSFPIIINNYFVYINSLVDSFDKTFSLQTKFISDKLLPYGDKIVRVKARDHVKSFLYGFKFHFVGRFTRKQQSASMWFRQGFLPSSSMKAEVDYGIFTIPLKFSACTVKVWLYKGFYVPKRTFSYGKWL